LIWFFEVFKGFWRIWVLVEFKIGLSFEIGLDLKFSWEISWEKLFNLVFDVFKVFKKF
jgi:hypothetical protein